MDERVAELGLRVFTFPTFSVKYKLHNTCNVNRSDSHKNNFVFIYANKYVTNFTINGFYFNPIYSKVNYDVLMQTYSKIPD